MEREAAMKAFSSFINEQNLNANQIVFVNNVINHIDQNGYVENIAALTKPPFDKPQSFAKVLPKHESPGEWHLTGQFGMAAAVEVCMMKEVFWC